MEELELARLLSSLKPEPLSDEELAKLSLFVAGLVRDLHNTKKD